MLLLESNSPTQQLLVSQLKKLFPNQNLVMNSRKDSNLQYVSGGAFMELDVWIPELNICFEFQDPYHYKSTFFYQHNQERILKKDEKKRSVVHSNKMTFVSIPCWWNGSLPSLGSTIYFHRPDLVENFGEPISLNPHLEFFYEREIPDVGELMLASFPLDEKFKNTMQNNMWWMGEKYDGMRFCWHSYRKFLFTRTGKVLELPNSFISQLPSVFLDGEFWFGRGGFSHTYMIVNGSQDFVHWHLMRMIVFDIPSRDLQFTPFEKRYELLVASTTIDHPFYELAFRVQCKHNKQLSHFVQEIIDNFGEGVILQYLGSFYEHGRNTNLIKLKTSERDAEAIVIGRDDYNITLKLPTGITFPVPVYDITCPLPEIGEIVTFNYERHNQTEIPLHPKIERVRYDVSWDDVINLAKKERRFLNEYSFAPSFNVHPLNKITTEALQKYMISFAKNKNLDPFNPSTWHSCAFEAIHRYQSGKVILQKFNGSYYSLMHYIFPDMQFDKNSFPEVEMRRNFFIQYASENNFDPSIPDNWYLQPRSKIMAFENSQKVMKYHNGSVSRALVELFPEVKFDRSKFPFQSSWRNFKRRRKFFENFALEEGFDFRDPNNWYHYSRKDFENRKGFIQVLSYHNNRYYQALLDLFPDIGLNPTSFPHLSSWGTHENRRKYFEEYARTNEFDFNVSDNWYQQSRENFLATKGAARVLSYYNNNFPLAIAELFPEIGINVSNFLIKKEKLNAPSSAKLLDITEQRNLFLEFAKLNNFDPYNPRNWYSISKDQIMRDKNLKKIISYYGNNLPKALIHLFPDVEFSQLQFPTTRVWHSAGNRRNFFINFAKINSFDPFVSDNWYSKTSLKQLKSDKSFGKILSYHNKNVGQALWDLFPDISFDKTKLWKTKN